MKRYIQYVVVIIICLLLTVRCTYADREWSPYDADISSCTNGQYLGVTCNGACSNTSDLDFLGCVTAPGANLMIYQWDAETKTAQACAAPDTWELITSVNPMLIMGDTSYGGVVSEVLCSVNVSAISAGTWRVRLRDSTSAETLCTVSSITASGVHSGTGSAWPTADTDTVQWEQYIETGCSPDVFLMDVATVLARE